MKIEMLRAPKSKEAPAEFVWWWTVKEDDGERIRGGTGWQFKRETSYGSAMGFMREERERRESNGQREGA